MARKDEPADEYAFPTSKFDEAEFMRREMQDAKATFLAVGLGAVAGVVARGIQAFADWRLGWVPIVLTIALMPQLLKRLGFGERETSWKAGLGNGFMIFATALTVWILANNF